MPHQEGALTIGEVMLVGSGMGSRTPVFVNFQDPRQCPSYSRMRARITCGKSGIRHSDPIGHEHAQRQALPLTK